MFDGLEQNLFQQLVREATSHLENLVHQLIEDHGIERDTSKWTKLITATSASLIGQRPDSQPIDPLPRDAVQVEVLLLDHGDMSPLIEILKGVVVRKPVAHRRMRTRIDQPRVLLLDGSLGGSSLSSLSSLDSIETQKLEGYKSIIKSKRPDVLVMTGGISRLFVEEFFESGITIVPDVSKQDAERLKRITGSKLYSIESLGREDGSQEDPLGSCDSFEVLQHNTSPDFGTDENPGEQTFTAPITLFKNDNEVFKTLIIRTQDSLEAEKLKEVMKAAVFAGLWNSLEVNFLFHFLRIERIPENEVTRRAITKIVGIRSKLKKNRRRILKSSPYYEDSRDPLDPSGIPDTTAIPFMRSQCLTLCVYCSNPSKGCLCEIPHLHSMSFYTKNDPSLLQFLDTISPSKVKCKHPACGEMASSHERSFLHGGNSVTVSSSHLDSHQHLDRFAWIWSDSPHSNACVKVPSTALHLSLSHFLLLLLETRCITDIAMQKIFCVHIKQRDILVCFRIEGCSLYSLCAPTSMKENSRQQRLWLQGECKSLEKEFHQLSENLEMVIRTTMNTDSQIIPDALEMIGEIRINFKEQIRILEEELENSMICHPRMIRKIDDLKFACILLSGGPTHDRGEEHSTIDDRNTKTHVSNDSDNLQIENIVLISNSRLQTVNDHKNPLEQLVLNFRNLLETCPELYDINEINARGLQDIYSFIQDGSDRIVYHITEPSSAIASLMSTSVYEQYIANAFQVLGVRPEEGSLESLKYSLDSTRNDCQIKTTDISCKIYCSLQFHALREVCIDDGNQAFLSAIKRSLPWNAEGGKSNAHFARTLNGQYVIKQLSKSEKKSFLQFSQHYFEHMRQHLMEGKTSFLAKIFGVFQLSVQANTAMQVFDFMILENLFRERQVQQIYDLKGLSKERYNLGITEGNSVLFDGNLREKNQKLPTFVSQKSHEWLSNILTHDTEFLSKAHVMDYSLLIGFDDKSSEIIIGIVDYLRQYTWDKHVESWVKYTALLGSSGEEPTVISPIQYAQRFLEEISAYFTAVPFD